MRRAEMLEVLPEDKHHYARWMYKILCEHYAEMRYQQCKHCALELRRHASLTIKPAHFRQIGGLPSRMNLVPHLEMLASAGLIRYEVLVWKKSEYSTSPYLINVELLMLKPHVLAFIPTRRGKRKNLKVSA